MILIIGGAYQGKTEYAEQLLRDSRHGQELLDDMGHADGVTYADGSVDSFDKAMNCPVILGFHHYVRQLMEQAGADASCAEPEIRVTALIDGILSVNRDVIITMNEIGYGIVPMSREDRAYREAVGRAGQKLAREASRVYRVLCGIGTQIK